MKTTEVALIISELEKARAALTVLYEQSSKEQKELATDIAKLEQRCKASEARLARIETTLAGTNSGPGVLTQLYELKKQTIRTSDVEESDIVDEITCKDPAGSISVHPAWIYVVVPIMFTVIVILSGILIFYGTK